MLAYLEAFVRPTLYIDPELCEMCSSCSARRACRPRAILQLDRGELPAVDAARCLGCKACVVSCPHGALRIVETPSGANGAGEKA
ncbi:MAG: ATP-binding protein [Nitrososphaerales archaeon]